MTEADEVSREALKFLQFSFKVQCFYINVQQFCLCGCNVHEHLCNTLKASCVTCVLSLQLLQTCLTISQFVHHL